MRSLVRSVVLIMLIMVILVTVFIRSAATVVMVQAQAPLFRSGIELLEVDASVVSSSTGTLVTDLQGGDFTVLVDGKPRQVVSAEYVSDLFQRAGRPNDAPDASISTNQDHRRGRLIVLALDQNNMTIGRVRAMSSAAGRFIDGLDPADQVALYGFPMPGPAVDFTTDHEAVKRELGALRGYTSADRLQFNIADHEAFLFDLRAEPMQMAAVLTRPAECVIIDLLASFAAHPAAFCAMTTGCALIEKVVPDNPAATLKGVDCAADIVSGTHNRVIFYEPEFFRTVIRKIGP